MLHDSLVYLISIIAGNIIGYLVKTRIIKRKFRLSDFFRSNLNVLLCLIFVPSFTDPNFFLKSLYFILFMATVNTAMDFVRMILFDFMS